MSGTSNEEGRLEYLILTGRIETMHAILNGLEQIESRTVSGRNKKKYQEI